MRLGIELLDLYEQFDTVEYHGFACNAELRETDRIVHENNPNDL